MKKSITILFILISIIITNNVSTEKNDKFATPFSSDSLKTKEKKLDPDKGIESAKKSLIKLESKLKNKIQSNKKDDENIDETDKKLFVLLINVIKDLNKSIEIIEKLKTSNLSEEKPYLAKKALKKLQNAGTKMEKIIKSWKLNKETPTKSKTQLAIAIAKAIKAFVTITVPIATLVLAIIVMV